MVSLYKITQKLEFTATPRDLTRLLRVSQKEIKSAAENGTKLNGFRVEKINLKDGE